IDSNSLKLKKPTFREVREVIRGNIIEKMIEIEYPDNAVERWYKIDDGEWRVYTSEIILLLDSDKEDGQSTITTRAVDQFGNETSSSIIIFSAPPKPILTLSPTSVEKGKDVVLNWNDHSRYTFFEVWLGTGTSGTKQWDILQKSVKKSTQYSFNTFNLSPGTTVYAQVAGYYYDGDDEGYNPSARQTFKVIAPVDNQPPTAPVLSTTSITDTSIAVKWTPSTDNVGLKEYQVFRNNTLLYTFPTSTTSYTYSMLTPSTEYSLFVKAVDLAGNISTSNTLTVKTTGRDTIPPSIPTVTTLSKTHNSVTLSYSATDNVGVVKYQINMTTTGDVYEYWAAPTETTHTIRNLLSDRYYYFVVTAYDAEGNSRKSSNHGVKTNPAPVDTQPPTAPVLSAPSKTD
ncbi:fibronectin type III domain-containing protein, partial [Salmonella enterica]|nr:fibronectin type III domain-containing protein [Salmonella enterica]